MRPTEPEIPDKKYFRIGEVSALTGLETYVLRYWETEFPHIRPFRSRSGQRLYRKKDIAAILEIKTLLHDQRFTIAGARQHLKTGRDESQRLQQQPEPMTLEKIKEALSEIRKLLDDTL
jgi:DNA-binding transcriptional MerR regulator